jgi:hypothetical protein
MSVMVAVGVGVNVGLGVRVGVEVTRTSGLGTRSVTEQAKIAKVTNTTPRTITRFFIEGIESRHSPGSALMEKPSCLLMITGQSGSIIACSSSFGKNGNRAKDGLVKN